MNIFIISQLDVKISVTSAWREPIPGYTEGIHGINGWCLAAGRGVLRYDLKSVFNFKMIPTIQ